MKRLYDMPKGTRINCEVSDGSTYIIFDHLDGMYSYCKSEKGNVVHLAAAAPLHKVRGKNEYTIAE